MKRYVKQAKDEKLNWQTLLIDDAQTDLKLLIKSAVINKWKWQKFNSRAKEIILEAVDELELPELKAKARQSLANFAVIEYRKARDALRKVDTSLLSSAVIMLEGNYKQKLKASKELARVVQGDYIENAQPLREFSRDYIAKVKKAFNELASSSAKDNYSSNVSLRNISEMSVRWNDKQAMLNSLQEKGVRLVWISSHANCSERCERWQGRLYSLDGTSGTEDGIAYQPLENAMNVYQTTKSGKTYRNGCISGYNCRHELMPYKKGSRPIEVSAKVIERQRDINSRQREYERAIRHERTKAELAVLPSERKYYRSKAVELNKKYIDYSKRNNVAYYPSRLQITDDDIEQLNKKMAN